MDALICCLSITPPLSHTLTHSPRRRVDLASKYTIAEPASDSKFAVTAGHFDFLCADKITANAKEYCPDVERWTSDPYVSPLRASDELWRAAFGHKQTQIWVALASHELLAPDIRALIRRWRETDVSVSVCEEAHNAVHDWLLLADFFGAEAQRGQLHWAQWMSGLWPH
jgi:acetyl esterase/lipase